ncbi:MAG: DUF4157 domain-containing protein [Pseudomonadota bacterium]
MRHLLGRLTVQRATTIGRSDDACEREAEAIGRRVAAGGRPGPGLGPGLGPGFVQGPEGLSPAEADVQRQSETEEGERPGEYLVQPRLSDAAAPPPVPRGFETRLASLRAGGGIALPAPLKADMEQGFGEDFEDVRLFEGPEAAALAGEIGARAFTVGEAVVFAEGAYAPASASGRGLIAHELTHVAQQRGPRREGAVAELAPSPATVQRDDLGFIARQALSLVRRYAPRLAPMIELGPVEWLRTEVAKAFDGIIGTISQLNLGAIVDTLTQTFGAMLTTASEIATALLAGDCGPLFAAIERLKNFVSQVAGEAWAKLTEFLEPVGDFFRDLWSSVGAPAVEWLQRFAGDLWNSIRDFGRYIWDQTQPIRDTLTAAWNWVKDQLFGPEDASGNRDSAQGIIGWIQGKAAQAFDYVKQQTRPVWEPLSQAVETVTSLIPPQFLSDLGEKMENLGSELGEAADATGQGGDLAENREAVAAILPSVDDVLSFVRTQLVAAGLWLTSTIGALVTRVSTFFTRMRANTFVRPLAGLLSWFDTAVTSLGAWAREKVQGMFTFLVNGFDTLRPFVQRLIDTVGRVISVVTDLIQLPQLVLSAVWNLIPECIREPIKDFLLNQILARIPVFAQLQAIGNLWNRVQEVAFRILRQLFVDGNLPGAAWTFFSSMLDLIGLPAQLVVGILAKAASAIGRILQDPIGFLINTLKAVGLGFRQFFGNFLRHITSGIAGWLFGAVSEAGLTPPADLSLRSILGFVMQILDITVERVMQRLELRIGAQRVARLRQMLRVATGVWTFVRVLIEEGPAGLWRILQERLSDLWNLVLNTVISYASTQIMTVAATRLASFLDPSGITAAINLAITIYRAIESVIRYLRQMLEIVSRVLDGINGIATGAIGQAANFLENAMGRALPVAIGFLANQAGFGDISTRIREFVEGVRARVNAALDWVIDRAIRLGQGFLALLQRGAQAVAAGVGAIRDWWQARKGFRARDGSDHAVYVERQGTGARVMVSSDPQTYRQFIEGIDNSADKTQALGIADELDDAIAAAARDPSASANAGSGGEDAAGSAAPDNHATTIQGLLDRLATVTAEIMPADATGPSSPPIFGSPVLSYGSSATVARLTKQGLPEGSPPGSTTSESWRALRRRGGNNSTYYVRGHLLNDNIGGPGTTWSNLTPLTQEANNRSDQSHLRGFEQHVKRAVLDEDRAVNFVCVANYGRSQREAQAQRFEDLGGDNNRTIAAIIREEHKVPTTVDCSARELNEEGAPGNEVWQFTVNNTIATDDPSYSVYEGATASQTIYVNDLSDSALRTTLTAAPGIGGGTVDKLLEHRPFALHAELDAALGTRMANRLRNEFTVRLSQRATAETEDDAQADAAAEQATPAAEDPGDPAPQPAPDGEGNAVTAEEEA